VARAGEGFRVELHGEGLLGGILQTFASVVIGVEISDGSNAFQTLLIHNITVVLNG